MDNVDFAAVLQCAADGVLRNPRLLTQYTSPKGMIEVLRLPEKRDQDVSVLLSNFFPNYWISGKSLQ